MFVGTTPEEIRILLQDVLKDRKGEDVFVGCSGNFSTDKVLAGMGFKVHSNDVSLYSKLIADIVMGTDTEVKVIDSDLINVFSQWEESKYKKLVQVMFAMRLSKFVKRKNDYEREFYHNFIVNAKGYYEKTVTKMEKNQQLGFQISSFSYCDFIEHLKTKKPNQIGISFPPTYKGGYEKMFQYVEDSFNYKRAKYAMFDPAKAENTFLELLEQGENIIYSDRENEKLQNYEIAKAYLGHGKNTVYIYSSLVNTKKKYYIEKSKKALTTKYKIIDINKQFDENTNIEIEPCQLKDVNYFKSFFMSAKVDYSEGGDFALVLLADGEAFGFVSFNKQLSTFSQIFIHSDFVVNSVMPKLSKLLILLLKSKEVQRQIIRFYKHYYLGLRTSVYTQKPVSMKYRGVFNLDKRDKGKLIYSADFTKETAKEIYLLWLKKYQK